jgi:hypothetical protein
MKSTIDCLNFRGVPRNTLRGFATIRLVEARLFINDVALHQQGQRRWPQLPSWPVIKNGSHAVDPSTCKLQYAHFMDFETAEVRAAFSAAVWRALLAEYPDAADTAEVVVQ